MLKPCHLCSDYLVSDEGYVLKKNGKDKLKGSINRRGYKILHLMVNGQNIAVSEHVLVARIFCKGYSAGLQVNHKNGIKTDNHAANLEWVTNSENMIHAAHILNVINANNKEKISCYDMNTRRKIRTFESMSEAARTLKLSLSVLSCVSRGLNTKGKISKTTAYAGYYWQRGENDMFIL